MAYRDSSDYSSGEAPLDGGQPESMLMQRSGGVRLSALQTTALDVLNKVMLSKDDTSPSPDTTREIATLQLLAPQTQTVGAIRLGRPQDEMMLGSWHEDVGKELLRELPNIITPEFKNNLKILAELI